MNHWYFRHVAESHYLIKTAQLLPGSRVQSRSYKGSSSFLFFSVKKLKGTGSDSAISEVSVLLLHLPEVTREERKERL